MARWRGVNRSRREEPSRVAARSPEFLADVVRAGAPAAALSVMADGFVDKLGARAAYVYRLPCEASGLVLAACRRTGSQLPAEGPPPGWRPLEDAARTKVVQFANLPQPANSQYGARWDNGGVTVVLPLCAAGRVLGAIAASFVDTLSPEDCRALSSVGEVLGGLLDALTLRAADSQSATARVAELEASARQRDEWTHTLAYELRLVLINILLLAGQLARQPTEAEAPASMRQLLDHTDRFNHLVRKLLDAAGSEYAELALERKRADLVGFIERFVAERRWNEVVRVRSRGSVPELSFDPQRLADVLVNLIANLCRTTPIGMLELLIERTAGEVEIAVTRAGEQVQPMAGDPIVEVFLGAAGLGDDASSVGMDVCRALIAAHGGRLWFESSRDCRSYRFSLPL